MGGGVTFTEKSAERIAKVVKQVETTPVGEPVLQRRRAGGYRMESLWEVTAVQTGEETVTLKRVQDTADNLNDRSETVEVSYIPQVLAPLEGDQGLIVRLGDGTRFFFRRQKVNRVYITEVARVKDTTPNVNDGNWIAPDLPGSSNAGFIVKVVDSITPANAYEERFACKIAQQLPVAESLPLSGTIRISNSTLIEMRNMGGDPFVSGITFRIQIQPILDDFDPTTLTWNQLAGLTKGTAVGGFLSATVQRYTFPPSGVIGAVANLAGVTFQHAGSKNNWEEAYGIELFLHTSPIQIPSALKKYQLQWGTFLFGKESYIEWPGG